MSKKTLVLLARAAACLLPFIAGIAYGVWAHLTNAIPQLLSAIITGFSGGLLILYLATAWIISRPCEMSGNE